MGAIPGFHGFSITPTQAAFSNVLTGLIEPFRSGTPPFLYKVDPNTSKPNWLEQPHTHITSLIYTTSTTAHTVTVLRPLNFTWFPSGLAKNTTAIPDSSGASGTGIFSDPGLYSTSYKYALPGSTAAPAAPSDQAISSTNKFVAYQLSDGTWRLDTIASGTFGSTLTLTTGTPNTTSGTIIAGGPLFYFGTTTLLDPATNKAHQLFLTIASTNKAEQLAANGNQSGIPTLHRGDPLMVHSNNATATGIIEYVAGEYRYY